MGLAGASGSGVQILNLNTNTFSAHSARHRKFKRASGESWGGDKYATPSREKCATLRQFGGSFQHNLSDVSNRSQEREKAAKPIKNPLYRTLQCKTKSRQ